MLDAKDIHAKYRSQLRPYLEMLKHKKHELNDEQWMRFVRKTKRHVINVPDQYLTDPPKGEILELLINNLFTEFLHEMGNIPDS
jgi:hypothetical protein